MHFSLDFTKFIDLGYWLNPTPPSGQLLFLISTVLFTLIILGAGIVVWFLARRNFKDNKTKRRVLEWVYTTLFSFIPVNIILILLRVEGIGYISWRGLWPLLFLLVVGLNSYYVYYYLTAVPKEINKIETVKLKQKYFRTTKKKSFKRKPTV